ncbi:Uncharacterized membrane protein YgdD, TMEM256/DUF423 family [Paenibacillus catalpae]|uniref:Uncharacterized membrane protein YgdD, TMEM256/DUF423 family n=1 Tax=Paenibacillus catalpae TaxID=1045775 RepID=A0A1I1YSL7_9BACL|nr:DUF423 domain-containing protein [Paenibacillus catalpae]SFE21143.1 Uncharacterized membrane protein YgdD, TMEM256/DUF423 family [Paenibacillus catalpae]
MSYKYFAYGAIGAALAVALGAFGAHGLKDTLTEDMLEVYETGVRYHMYHALALMLLALLSDRIGDAKLIRVAARLLIAGIILFSGSLYALALSDVKVLGAITPLGGVAFLAGWGCVAAAALRARNKV